MYWLERNSEYVAAAREHIVPVLNGDRQACVATLLITELLAGSHPNLDMSFLSLPSFTITSLNDSLAYEAGRLARRYRLKPADAVHLASALSNGASEFVTNDQRLLKITLPGLQIKPLVAD